MLKLKIYSIWLFFVYHFYNILSFRWIGQYIQHHKESRIAGKIYSHEKAVIREFITKYVPKILYMDGIEVSFRVGAHEKTILVFCNENNEAAVQCANNLPEMFQDHKIFVSKSPVFGWK